MSLFQHLCYANTAFRFSHVCTIPGGRQALAAATDGLLLQWEIHSTVVSVEEAVVHADLQGKVGVEKLACAGCSL